MIRKQSVILTPAEKKLAVNNAKDSAKAAKVKHATLTKDRAKLEKDHAAALKLLERNHREAVATATKTYAATAKESDKALKAAAIALTKADADVLKLVPTVAPTAKPAAAADAVTEKAVPTETA